MQLYDTSRNNYCILLALNYLSHTMCEYIMWFGKQMVFTFYGISLDYDTSSFGLCLRKRKIEEIQVGERWNLLMRIGHELLVYVPKVWNRNMTNLSLSTCSWPPRLMAPNWDNLFNLVVYPIRYTFSKNYFFTYKNWLSFKNVYALISIILPLIIIHLNFF